MKTSKNLILIAALGMTPMILLSSCTSKKSSSNSASAPATVSGVAMAGEISNGTVTAYPVDASTGLLIMNEPLGTTTSDAHGNYSLTVNEVPDGLVAIQVTNGSYAEEAGGTVKLGSNSITTILPGLAPNSSVIAAVTPLTDMATHALQSQIQAGLTNGTTPAQAAKNANYQMSQAFGVTDIVGLLPTSPSSTLSNDDHGTYEMVLVGISKAAADAKTDSIAMSSAMLMSYTANGGNFSSLGDSPLTVINANGKSVTILPPSMDDLGGTVSDIASGKIVLAGISASSDFKGPSMNANPGMEAPADWPPPPSTEAAPSPSASPCDPKDPACQTDKKIAKALNEFVKAEASVGISNSDATTCFSGLVKTFSDIYNQNFKAPAQENVQVKAEAVASTTDVPSFKPNADEVSGILQKKIRPKLQEQLDQCYLNASYAPEVAKKATMIGVDTLLKIAESLTGTKPAPGAAVVSPEQIALPPPPQDQMDPGALAPADAPAFVPADAPAA